MTNSILGVWNRSWASCGHYKGTSSREEPLSLPSLTSSGSKSYDYLLKVLLVGDSDVGKQEILSGLDSGCVDSVYCSSTGAAYKTTTILIDGKRVKLQIWDTRNFEKPIISLDMERPVSRVAWCPTRPGLLASVGRDSGSVSCHQNIQQDEVLWAPTK